MNNNRLTAEIEIKANQAQRVEELVFLYESRASEVANLKEAATLLARAAGLANTRLNKPFLAEELLQRALAYDPHSLDALREFQLLCEQRTDLLSLAETLERVAELCNPEESVDCLLRAAHLFEQLHLFDRAERCCRLAVKTLPSHRETFRQARRILIAVENFSAAYELLQQEATQVPASALVEDYLLLAEAVIEDPQSLDLTKQVFTFLAETDASNERFHKLQQKFTQFSANWKAHIQTLRDAAQKETNRQQAAKHFLKIAKTYAFFESDVALRKKGMKEALDQCFLLWPAMSGALSLLEHGAKSSGRYDIVVSAFEKLAQETKDKNAKVALYLRLGQLALEKLSNQAAAATAFENAALNDPTRGDVVGMVVELALARGDISKALQLLEKSFEAQSINAEKAKILVKVADIALTYSKDESKARRAFEKALSLTPKDGLIVFQLAQLLLKAGDVSELAALLHRTIKAPKSLQERVAFCEEAALLFAEKSEPMKAFLAWTLAVQLLPSKTENLQKLEQAAALANAQDEYLQLLRKVAQKADKKTAVVFWKTLARQLSASGKANESKEAWMEVQKIEPQDEDFLSALESFKTLPSNESEDARLRLLQQARDLETAAASPQALLDIYREVLKLEPGNTEVLHKMVGVNEKLERWDEAAVYSEQLVALLPESKERNAWRIFSAKMQSEKLGRKDEAVQAYLSLLAEGEGSADVISSLEQLATEGIQQVRISKALAPHYAQVGDHQRQVASLLIQVSSSEDKAERMQLLSLLAETAEKHLADLRAAFEFRLQGIALDADNLVFRNEAKRLAAALNAHAEYARALLKLAQKHTGNPTLLCLDAADVARQGNATTEAIEALQLAFGHEPSDAKLFESLAELLRNSGRWTELETLLKQQIAAADTQAKASLWLRAVEVSEKLSRPKEAAVALKAAISAGADEKEHVEKLADLQEQAGLLDALLETLERQLAFAKENDDAAAIEAVVKRKQKIAEHALSAQRETILKCQEVLAKKPNDEKAIETLERLLANPDAQAEAARALLPTYERARDYRKWVLVLDLIAQTATDSLEKINAFRQIAAIQAKFLKQPEQSFVALTHAMRLAPDDKQLRLAARLSAEQADVLDMYAEVLEEMLEASQSSGQVGLRRELADVFEKLGQPQKATQQLEAVIALEPNNIEVLENLLKFYRVQQNWNELVQVLERLADVSADLPSKLKFGREAALVSEENLQDKVRAAQNWRLIAERDVSAKDAAIALERLYSALEWPQELVFALELRRAQEGETPLGLELTFRLAQLRRERLQDHFGALQLYRQILLQMPSNEPAQAVLELWAQKNDELGAQALETVDPIWAKQNEHSKRVFVREALLDQVPPLLGVQLIHQICTIQERDLGQPSAAFMSALKAFSRGLERETLQADLERLAKATASELELAEVYESVAGQLSDADEHKQKWLRRSAQLWEEQSQMEDALRMWQLLLKIVPEDSQALERLEKLYSQNKNAAELAHIYLRKADLSTEVGEKVSWLNQAGLAFETAGNEQKAHDIFKLSIALQPMREALEALERFYARNKQFGAQADVLSRLMEMSSLAPERLRLLTKRAQLLERESRFQDAIQAWNVALQIQPSYPEAIAGLEGLLENDSVRSEVLQSLEPHYRQAQDYKKLAELLEQKLEFSEKPARAKLLGEIAQLCELLGEKKNALNALVRAYEEDAGNEVVQKELERLSAELGAFDVLVGCYEGLREKELPAEVASVLARKVAVLYREKLNRPDAAVRVWIHILEQQPQLKDAKEALEALSQIYRELQKPKELAWVMQQQVTLEEDPRRKVRLLENLAEIAQAILLDNSMAISCFQNILQHDPRNAHAAQNLLKLLPEAERYPEFAQLLAQQIQQAKANGEEDKELEIKVRLGRLMAARLENPRAALNLFAEALAQRKNYPQAIGALEEMVKSNSSLRGEAAKLLEPIFSGGGDHLKLVQTLESRLESETEEKERLGLFLRIAQIYKKELANLEMAFLTAVRSLQEFPGNSELLKECSDLAEATGSGDEFVGLLEEIVEKTTNGSALANIYRMRALWQMKLKDSKGSIQSWLQLLEHAPADFQALQEISCYWEANNELEKLLELIKRQLFLEEDAQKRCDLMLRLGSIQERLKEYSNAAVTFRRLLEILPDHPQALECLERIYEQQQHWPELADVLVRRLAVVESEERYPIMLRLAMVKEGRLADLQGALELYAQLLRHNPRFPGAIERINAIVRKSPHEVVAVNLLLESHRATHNRDGLIQVIENRVAVSTDASERHALLSELAKAREAQGEPELAFWVALRAFKEAPQDEHGRNELVRLAEASASFEELADTLKEALSEIFDPRIEAGICLELALVYEKHLNEFQSAAHYYEQALRAGLNVPVDAWKSLDRIYGKLEQHQRQVEILEQLLAATKEGAEKISLLYRIGELYEHKLKDMALASYAYERILEIDSGNVPSARALEFLYESLGEYEKLRTILQAQRELVSGSEKDRVTAKLASLTADVSEDFSEAIALYEELVAKNPRNDQAAQALENLLERAGQPEQLLHLIKRRLTVVLEPRELVRLNQAAGQVLWKQQGKPKEAIAYFKAALERDIRAKGALEALRDIFDEQGQKEDLIVVLQRLVRLQTEPLAIKEIRLKLAEVLASLNRREEALESTKRAMEIEPHTIPMLERALGVFCQLQAWNDAVRTLELETQLFLEEHQEEEAVRALFQVVDIWKTKIGKPENGGAALEKIFLIDTSNRSAYEQALGLYASVNDWRSYVQTINRFLPNFVSDDDRVAALCNLARVQEQKLGQKDVAFLQLCRALQLQPENEFVREGAVRLANETQSYEELAAVFEEIAEALPSGPLASQIYRLLADIQDKHLGDVDAAETSFQKILEFDPTSRDALAGLESLLERYKCYQSLAAVLDRKIELSETPEDKKKVLLKLAILQEKYLDSPGAATRSLERAFELIPDHSSLNALCLLRREQGEFELMVANILRLRELVPAKEAAELQLKIAQIYENDLEDAEAAIEAYRGVLTFDRRHLLALKSIERLLSSLDRPRELLELLEQRVAVSEDFSERVALHFQQADIWENRLQNLDQADACIEAVLEIDPNNAEALRALERLRYSQGDWHGLVEVFEKQLVLRSKPSDKARLWVVMGQVLQQKLADVERATLAYQQAINFNPQNREAVHALAGVFEAQKNWPAALEMLRREARLVGDDKSAAPLCHHIGHIQAEEMGDLLSAKKAYLEALRFDESHLPSLIALKSIYRQEEAWSSYESVLNRLIQQTAEPETKSQYLVEFGDYLREVKEDLELAENVYAKALKETPTLLAAARPLVDLCVVSERWPEAKQALEVVAQHLETELPQDGDGSKARELCRFVYRLAYVCEKLEDDVRALECFQRAHELDPSYLPALEGLGNRLVKSGRNEEALHVYQNILIYHRDDLTDLEVVEIYWMLGDIYVSLLQLDKATSQFERALAMDAQHEPSLMSLSKIAESMGKWEQVADCYHRLLRLVEEDRQYSLAMSLGEVSKTHLNDTATAMDAYSIALRSRPNSLKAMENLCALSEEMGQFAKAGGLMAKMLQVEEVRNDIEKSKKTYLRLGILLRDKLSDIQGASTALNAALDLDFRFIEAFRALESMLGKHRRWGELESNYHRMIQRLPKTDEMFSARMALFRTLGDLYLNVLGRAAEALQVYAVLAKGLPRDTHVQETYATLARGAGQFEEALAAYRRASLTTQNLAKVAVDLTTLSLERKQLDAAWLSAQAATVFLGATGEDEKAVVQKLTPWARKKGLPQTPLTSQHWNVLYHPHVRGPQREFLGLLYLHAGALFKEDCASYQINPRKHQLELSKSLEYQLGHLREVSRVLGVDSLLAFSPFLVASRAKASGRSSEMPPEASIGLEICNTSPISIKLGGRFFAETGPNEVCFWLAQVLTLMRPEFVWTRIMPLERLEILFQAAVAVTQEPFPYTANVQQMEPDRQALERVLPVTARNRLKQLAKEMVASNLSGSLAAYFEGAEFTSLRAGALLATELAPVKKILSAEQGVLSPALLQRGIRELIEFMLSEDLVFLRKDLGIQLEVG